LVNAKLGEHFQPVMEGLETKSYSDVSHDLFPVTLYSILK